MSSRVLLLDFDGTLVDISRKYWFVYSTFVRMHDGIPLEREEYWSIKRSGASDGQILAVSGVPSAKGPELGVHIRRVIESPDALEHDELFPGVKELLHHLSRKSRFYLVSARRNRGRLLEQVESFNISSYFESIITPTRFNDDPRSMGETPKSDVIPVHVRNEPDLWMVGDSRMDIETGRILRATTCAVLTGVRDAAYLKALKPDHLLSSILDLDELMSEQTLEGGALSHGQ